MSGVGIFKSDRPEIIGVDVDLRISELHKAESTITNQPIEDGSVVSDHIILQPTTIEIIAEMSNFDGNDSQSLGERATTAWDEFKRSLESRTLFDVVTHHELYTNMAMETLSGEHVAPHTGKMQIKIAFRSVDSTQLGIVEIPESQLSPDIAKAGSSQVDGGRQVPLTPENQSGLFAALQAKEQADLSTGATQ